MNNEATIRLACFVAILVLLVAGESLWPRRARPVSRKLRWPNNILVVFIDTILARIVMPAGATGIALIAEERGWGLLNNVGLASPAAIVVSILILDLAIYAQHWLFHHVPWLWRLHRMHHVDLDVDVTTGARFHPFEILLSLGIKAAIVIAIGAPAESVLIFEVLLNATSMFNHTNVRLPPKLEPWLRWIVVTPDMHRVHHSIVRRETDSNFGFNLPWWDRLFRTYRAQPEAGHERMTLGIEQFREHRELHIHRMLVQPFRKER